MSLRSDRVKQLEEMGFSSQRAHRALAATHDCGTEAALSWLVENATKLDQEHDGQQHDMISHPSAGPSEGVMSHPC
jgi:uncharacterized UBP type Zn finger protein